MKGIKRLKSRPADKRLPVTPFILAAIREVLDRKADDYDNMMLWAACCLGFFAFLRSGEFTVPNLSSFDPSLHLTPLDIATDSRSDPKMVMIRIKASKCDQTKQGVTVCVGRTDCRLCPVTAILTYSAIRGTDSGTDSGPFFQCSNRQPLTKQKLINLMRKTLQMAGIDPSHYCGHSFRIGAATTAGAHGLPDSTIQTLGRWSSDSFRRYIRLPPQELASISRSLVNLLF